MIKPKFAELAKQIDEYMSWARELALYLAQDRDVGYRRMYPQGSEKFYSFKVVEEPSDKGLLVRCYDTGATTGMTNLSLVPDCNLEEGPESRIETGNGLVKTKLYEKGSAEAFIPV